MSDFEDLPGRLAEGIAQRIERRRFFRRTATAIFTAAALVSVGEVMQVMKATSAFACDCNDSSCTNGAGCPSGGVYGLHPCGPSPCCSSLSSSCDCGSNGSCKDSGNCLGTAKTSIAQAAGVARIRRMAASTSRHVAIARLLRRAARLTAAVYRGTCRRNANAEFDAVGARC
jgi:hypothetical protein